MFSLTSITITNGNTNATGVNVASFISSTGTMIVPTIPGGIWQSTIHASSTHASHVSYYYNVSYVNSNGTGSKTSIVNGSYIDSTIIGTNLEGDQGNYQDDCGLRSLAWAMLTNKYGINDSKEI